ncbi:hypothetical protein L207DRAFT_520836 [Hyaloscypha variabilis F]|uniref:Uncharacterized protein n=1 Tax=Hyaloscypha variabilis (strain UAMH 11265 / GT02V1 / F) TaxID=1149755 RepID=A0A2J6QTI0_HYAVF|nr:hypothetical protein L207DRAFT_520836 [Hyaloscypha variabilis F]
MKPITLGSSFSGRIFYHETIHALAGHIGGYSFKDWGYLVDEDAKQTAPTRNMMVENTYFSTENPDTYSFWAIMAWRRQNCKWTPPVWPFQTIIKGKTEDFLAKFPITTIRVDPEKEGKGIYGVPQYCPGQRVNDGFPKDLTKPTMDVVKNTDGSNQDLLWCKFTNQESPDTACTGEWKWGALTVMGDGGGDVSLLGCFKSVSLGVQEELENFTAIKDEI